MNPTDRADQTRKNQNPGATSDRDRKGITDEEGRTMPARNDTTVDPDTRDVSGPPPQKPKAVTLSHTTRLPRAPSSVPDGAGDPETWFSGRRAAWTVLAGLAVLAVLVYGNAVSNGFVFDDYQQVVHNAKIRSLKNVPDILGLTTGEPYYRPIRTVTYAIDYALAGLAPWIYHLTNILYHLIASFLVYLVVTRLTRVEKLGAIATLLFFLHPVQTDAVTYISGRRDILSALFYLLGFYLYIRRRDGGPWWLIPLTGLAYVLGIFSKEMAVTLPAVCILYDFVRQCQTNANAPRGRSIRWLLANAGQTLKAHALLYGGFLAMSGVFVVYKLVIKNPSFMQGYHGGSFLATVATEFRVISHFLGLLVWPLHLNSDYSINHFPVSHGLMEIRVVLSGLLVLALLTYGFTRFRSRPVLGFGVLWFFIVLLPVSHVFPHHELLAEHYLYLPIVGVVLAAAYGYRALEGRVGRTFAGSALVIVAALFAGRTILRNRDYRDHETFWTVAVQTAPDCSRAHQNLGLILSERGELEKARDEFQTAIRLDPQNAMAHYNLGYLYQKEGRWAESEEAYRHVLEVDPWMRPALINLAHTLAQLRRGPDALAVLKKIVSRWPTDRTTLCNLAGVYQAMGRRDETRATLVKLAEAHPRYADASLALGTMAYEDGNYEQALLWLRKAREANPDYGRPYLALGDCLVKMERLDEAVQVFESYLEHWPRSENRRKIATMIARLRRQIEDPEFNRKIHEHMNELQNQRGPIRKVKRDEADKPGETTGSRQKR